MFDMDLRPLFMGLGIIFLIILFGAISLTYKLAYDAGRKMGREDILSGRIKIVEVQETKKIYQEIK